MIEKKLYTATKALYKVKSDNNFVHDDEGNCITNPNEINQLIKEHFKQNLHDSTLPKIEPFRGQPRPLNKPIIEQEVIEAVKKFSNNKAPGEDQIQVEMIKYGPPILIQEIQKALNNIFTEHQDHVNINKSILIPAQKPNKKKGPIPHLRAINLLNTIRKIMSSITLKRINPKIDSYLSQSQAAYRKGRSTTDIVWAHRFIVAKTQKYQELEIYITGIDMSAAYDTIHRHKVIKELEGILDEDELRMAQLLISNTSIIIQTGNIQSEEVKTNIGSPQGDALSGTFFNVMFEASLRKVRAKVNDTQPMIEHSYVKRSKLPDELIYADDCDFENKDPEKKKFINEIVAETLKTDNLKVNESKTEHTIIKREKKRIDEKWRGVKKLGSLLGDSEDVIRRKQLSFSENEMSNEEVYRLSKSRPITQDIKEGRWRMFGHALRLNKETPAQKAMEYYFTSEISHKKYKGKPRMTLPVVLDKDIRKASIEYPGIIPLVKFLTLDDLNIARTLAEDRDQWKKLTKLVCNIA